MASPCPCASDGRDADAHRNISPRREDGVERNGREEEGRQQPACSPAWTRSIDASGHRAVGCGRGASVVYRPSARRFWVMGVDVDRGGLCSAKSGGVRF